MSTKDYFPEAVSLADAPKLQEAYAQELILRDEIPIDLKTIGGAAIHSRGNMVTVSIAILDANSFKVKESGIVSEKVKFPAIPTCEGFREGHVLVDIIDRFEMPQLFMIQGHGICHPRKFGLASHVGLAMDMPTIGVSNELQAGKKTTRDRRNVVLINDSVCGESIRYTPATPPLYVSPGHKITLKTAVKLVKKTMNGPLPEPLKVARGELQKKMLKQFNQM